MTAVEKFWKHGLELTPSEVDRVAQIVKLLGLNQARAEYVSRIGQALGLDHEEAGDVADAALGIFA